MIRKRSTAIAILILGVVTTGIWGYSNSLLRSEASIQRSLLRETPLGSSRDDCLAFAGERVWGTRVRLNGGFMKQDSLKPIEIVGDTSFSANLGHYWLPFRTDVEAFWGFDASGRLVEIWVRKSTDAL